MHDEKPGFARIALLLPHALMKLRSCSQRMFLGRPYMFIQRRKFQSKTHYMLYGANMKPVSRRTSSTHSTISCSIAARFCSTAMRCLSRCSLSAIAMQLSPAPGAGPPTHKAMAITAPPVAPGAASCSGYPGATRIPEIKSNRAYEAWSRIQICQFDPRRFIYMHLSCQQSTASHAFFERD